MPDIKKYPDITKKEFVTKFIEEFGAKSMLNPGAIFMAGLPGAGKTEFSKELIKNISGPKAIRIDMDEIASKIKGYRPEIADQYREPATKLLNSIYDETLKNHFEFVMDGTFGSKNAIKNIERALHHNYSIKIIYIQQNPKLAWKFTLAREKVEHRSIDINGFIEAYFNISANLIKLEPFLKKYDKISIDIITKNNNNKEIDSWLPNIKSGIDILLKTSYNKNTLRKYIDD